MSGRVVVIGAGISGLAAAYRLVERGVPVTVLEAAPRVGGQIRTEREDGFVLEAGADTLLTQKPWALDLCHRLGLGPEIEEQQGGAAILRGDRLVRVPEGFVLMAPTRRAPVLASPLFSLRGKLRLLAEPLIPRRVAEDESLASFVTRRFGREVLERVTEPVLAGLHIADADRMSLRMTAPRLLDLEAKHGSVTRGLMKAMRAHGDRPFGHGTGGGAFVALSTGMGQLVDALAARLPAGAIRTQLRVMRVTEVGSRRFTVDGDDGERFEAASVVFACPAFETARILGSESRLAYASCAVVHLAYRRGQLRAPMKTFGFFVPREARSRLLACSFVSEKFPGRAPEGTALVRAFLGGARHPGLLDDDDSALAAEAHAALAPVLGIGGGPTMTRVHRHPRAMPQYETGQASALARAVAAIEGRSGLFVVGGGAGAVGIPDCVRLAEATADRAAMAVNKGTATESRVASHFEAL